MCFSFTGVWQKCTTVCGETPQDASRPKPSSVPECPDQRHGWQVIKHILGLLDISQCRRPVTTKIFHYGKDLQVVLAANKELQYEACAEYFEGFDLPHTTKTQILRTVGQAYESAEEKLTKYMLDGQPAIEFLQGVRVFDLATPHS